jgi:hypothetical protein
MTPGKMRPSLPRGLVAVVLLNALLLAIGKPQSRGVIAQATDAQSSQPVRVSAPSPLPAGCGNSDVNPGRIYRNSVVEPSLAVDPGNPLHLVGAWQQDRIATSGAAGQIAAASIDGGRTWSLGSAAFSRCTGGSAAAGLDYERVSDPWVTISPNGTAYQMTVAFDDPKSDGSRNEMLVSRSDDGGLTWDQPVTLIHDKTAEAYNDKNSITADPRDSNLVYAVWTRELTAEETPDNPYVAPAMFARSTDRGRSWEQARAIYSPAGMAVTGNIILVLPNGGLVDVFTLNSHEAAGVRYDFGVVRSSDQGVSWSAPTIVTRMQTVDLVDPITTFTIRPTPDNIPSAAIDPRTGTLYATWTTGEFSGGKSSDIALVLSRDGGLTWSNAIRINQTPGRSLAFVPTIAVLDDGTVGVDYFDTRSNQAGSSGLLADHWLTSCRAGCAQAENWTEQHTAGPFDMLRAPYAHGFFIGDYMGIVGTGSAFDLLYVTTTPESAAESTAVWFTNLVMGNP